MRRLGEPPGMEWKRAIAFEFPLSTHVQPIIVFDEPFTFRIPPIWPTAYCGPLLGYGQAKTSRELLGFVQANAADWMRRLEHAAAWIDRTYTFVGSMTPEEWEKNYVGHFPPPVPE